MCVYLSECGCVSQGVCGCVRISLDLDVCLSVCVDVCISRWMCASGCVSRGVCGCGCGSQGVGGCGCVSRGVCGCVSRGVCGNDPSGLVCGHQTVDTQRRKASMCKKAARTRTKTRPQPCAPSAGGLSGLSGQPAASWCPLGADGDNRPVTPRTDTHMQGEQCLSTPQRHQSATTPPGGSARLGACSRKCTDPCVGGDVEGAIATCTFSPRVPCIHMYLCAPCAHVHPVPMCTLYPHTPCSHVHPVPTCTL